VIFRGWVIKRKQGGGWGEGKGVLGGEEPNMNDQISSKQPLDGGRRKGFFLGGQGRGKRGFPFWNCGERVTTQVGTV